MGKKNTAKKVWNKVSNERKDPKDVRERVEALERKNNDLDEINRQLASGAEDDPNAEIFRKEPFRGSYAE